MLRFLKSQMLRLFCLSALFIINSIIIFVAAASYLAVKPLDFVAPNVSPINAQVTFTTEVISADATGRTMVMDWYPGLSGGCDPNPGFVADIYFDPDLLDSSSPSFTSLPPFAAAYQLNATEACVGNSPIVTPVFRTITRLLGSDMIPMLTTAHSTLQQYPFDAYSARFSIWARDHDTGEVISLNVTRSYGVAVNFDVTLERAFVLGDVSPQLRISLKVGRSNATKAFVVLVAVSEWFIAAAFLIISAATLAYPNPRIYGEMFVLPIGVLFAFTSIRANLPGAPAGFGARIDLYTILPVLVVVTLCSFFLLLIVLYRRLCEEKKLNAPMGPFNSLTSQQTVVMEEDKHTANEIVGVVGNQVSTASRSLYSVAGTDEVGGDSLPWAYNY